MKKGIFAMFILLSSMAMVACTNTKTGGTEENQAMKVLEKRREYYKNQDKENAKMEAEAKKAEEQAMSQAEMTTEETVAVDDAEAKKAEEKAMKEALKILEKKRAN